MNATASLRERFDAMTPRDRRALSLGAMILAPALLFVLVVKPFLATLSDTREQLAVERDALSRERGAIAAALANPQLQQRADSAMRVAVPRLFAGRDDVMASAELATYIGERAREKRVWLQAADTRPAVAMPSGVHALRVDIRGESDLRGVLAWLRALETGAKLVRVERIDIARVSRDGFSGRAAGAAASGDDDMETLSVSATIVGYSLGADASDAAPPVSTTVNGKAP